MTQVQQTQKQDSFLVQTRTIVESLLELLPVRPFTVRLPDGHEVPPKPAGSASTFTLVIKQPGALRRMFLPPSELAMGEGYIFDDYDIEGDIATAFDFIDQLDWPRPSLPKLLSLIRQLFWLEWADRRDRQSRTDESGRLTPYDAQGTKHSTDRDQRSVQYHYDVSNDFYKLFLGKDLLYSCAYYAHPDEDLDSAQTRKIDLICRKLRLQPGERFLDIGCGWGALIIHAAAEYGVNAHGITLSAAQKEEALERIDARGLADHCSAELCHYEQYSPDGTVDKLASIGMIEHVGEEKLATYFNRMFAYLKPGGHFLLQVAVGRTDRRHAGSSWMQRFRQDRTAFARKYTFPDTKLLDLPTVLEASERAGFETRDVESLREHYPITFRQWLAGLEHNREAAIAEVGEPTYRCWRILFASYIHMLRRGYLADYQVLLVKPGQDGQSGLPLLRGGSDSIAGRTDS